MKRNFNKNDVTSIRDIMQLAQNIRNKCSMKILTFELFPGLQVVVTTA